MLRLLPRPGLLSSVVVATSVASGVAFGAMAMTAALVLRRVVHGKAARP